MKLGLKYFLRLGPTQAWLSWLELNLECFHPACPARVDPAPCWKRRVVSLDVRWKRGSQLLVQRPSGWRNEIGVTVFALEGKLALELRHVARPCWPLDLTSLRRRKPGDPFWTMHWRELAQYAVDRGGLQEVSNDCKPLLEGFFAFTSHYARVLMISWETVPDRFRKGPESKVMWFEERSEGGWDWKFETLGPGHQPRYEHRIYAILGAESRDRERLLLIPESPPIPYHFLEVSLADEGSVPERWLDEASRARARARSELGEGSA